MNERITSVSKRIRITEKAIERTKGKHKDRLFQKLRFLKSLPNTAIFKVGPKQRNQGGWVAE